ncbi:MAG: hypothetical protein R3317_01530, partial [Burkholderiaceae bacterium]|nr:hypothetical protein [Burkholderiaceae bacterium]
YLVGLAGRHQFAHLPVMLLAVGHHQQLLARMEGYQTPDGPPAGLCLTPAAQGKNSWREFKVLFSN